MTAPARLNLVSHGLKKPEIACLPTACAETLPFLPPTVLSCCRPDMGWQSWRFEGQPCESPHILVYNVLRVTPSHVLTLDRPRIALGVASPVRGFRRTNLRLLQLNLGASLLELSLDLLGFVLVHAFLDRLGRALYEVLGFLEAETSDGTDFLNDFDLLLAGGGEHDRELGLFFSGGSSSAATSRTGNRNGGSGGHAPLFFKELRKLGSLEHGEAREVIYNLL